MGDLTVERPDRMDDLTVERPDRMGDLTVESYEDGGAMPLRVYAYMHFWLEIMRVVARFLNQDLQDFED